MSPALIVCQTEDTVTEDDKRILLALIWALKPADLSVLQACLQGQADAQILAQKDSANGHFLAQLARMGLAAEQKATLPDDHAGRAARALNDLTTGYILTAMGREVLPQGIKFALSRGYPPEEALVDNATLSILQKYASAENAEAINKLAGLFLEGRGVPENEKQAAALYRKAAEKGDRLAHNNLGILHILGRGVAKDLTAAHNWFRLGAALGSTGAMDNLGELYLKGMGVPRDAEKAAGWFLMAANNGFNQAKCKLGVMYAVGDGVPKDDVQSYIWFSLGIADGLDAAKERDEVASRLTKTQLKEADKFIAAWKPEAIPLPPAQSYV